MSAFRIRAAPALLVVRDKRVKGRFELPRGSKANAAPLQPWLQ